MSRTKKGARMARRLAAVEPALQAWKETAATAGSAGREDSWAVEILEKAAHYFLPALYVVFSVFYSLVCTTL